MIFGVIFCRIRYPVLKYFLVLIIVSGVGLFMYDAERVDSAKSGKSKADSVGTGEILLLTSLVFDGITGVVQGPTLNNCFDVTFWWVGIGSTFSMLPSTYL